MTEMLGQCQHRGCAQRAVDVATVMLVDEEGNHSCESEFALCQEHIDWLCHRVLTAGAPPPDTWDWAA